MIGKTAGYKYQLDGELGWNILQKPEDDLM